MNKSAVISLVLTGGFVWGGFITLLAYGIWRERQKAREGRNEETKHFENHQQLER